MSNISIIIHTIIFPILALGLFTVLFLFGIGLFTFDAPFIPIPRRVLPHIRKALNLQSDSIVYDLGCGDGRVLIECSKDNPTGLCIGIELAQIPYSLARLYIFLKHRRNIIIQKQNLYTTDLSQATHIFAYLLPKALPALENKLAREARQGLRVVTCDFKLPTKTPSESYQIPGPKHGLGKTIYIYTY